MSALEKNPKQSSRQNSKSCRVSFLTIFKFFNVSFFQKANLVFLGGQQVISSEIEDQLALMIDKVAEWGFPVGKFELKLMVKDMLTKKGNYNQKKFRKAKVHKVNNKNTTKRCENYLTLTIKRPERPH